EKLTRVWYYHYLRPSSALARLWQRALYFALHRWIIEYNFSRQDEAVMLHQRYDTPEKLSATDAEVIQWRRLVVTKHYGGRDAPALKPFTQAYPEIRVEQTNLHSQDFAPRILQERQANIFTWDLALIPTSTALQVLRPAGVWDPVRPAIVLPEAKDDAGWEGGFERGFALVKDRALTYGFVANRGGGITINTDVVKEDQIRRLVDLLDPRWKGKLLLPDVRTMGDAFWPMTAARLNLGDDIIQR